MFVIMNSSKPIFDKILFVNDSDCFFEVYNLGPWIISLVAISLFVTLLLVPVLSSVVWYDWSGSDLKRIFTSRLASSIFLTCIGQLILVQIPEIVRYLTGPFPLWFCFWHYVLKNTIAMLQILYFDIIVAVRYLFIFHLKNPAMFEDQFWNFVINTLVVSFSFASQLIFAFLPGRQPVIYHFCSGECPSGF